MGLSFVRTVVLFFCVVVALRLMGKRQLGEMQPSELVVAIMISDLASVPMQAKGTPLLDGIVPIFTLVVLELLFSVVIMKNEFLRRVITGQPTVIIENGRFVERALGRLRLCVDDVLEQLRLAGYSDLGEVESAIIETNGQLSIIPKEASRPLTCEDMKIYPAQTHIPHTIIADGILRRGNMAGAGVDESWILKELQPYSVTDLSQVFYLSVTDDRKLFVQLKEAAR